MVGLRLPLAGPLRLVADTIFVDYLVITLLREEGDGKITEKTLSLASGTGPFSMAFEDRQDTGTVLLS